MAPAGESVGVITNSYGDNGCLSKNSHQSSTPTSVTDSPIWMRFPLSDTAKEHLRNFENSAPFVSSGAASRISQ